MSDQLADETPAGAHRWRAGPSSPADSTAGWGAEWSDFDEERLRSLSIKARATGLSDAEAAELGQLLARRTGLASPPSLLAGTDSGSRPWNIDWWWPSPKRGTGLERGLGVSGIALWVLLAVAQVVWSPNEYLLDLLLPALALLSAVEFRRWQLGKDALRIFGRRESKAYPSTAWFAVGAVAAPFVTGLIEAAFFGASSSTRMTRISGYLAWIVGGSISSFLLVRNARRRDRLGAFRTPSRSVLSQCRHLRFRLHRRSSQRPLRSEGPHTGGSPLCTVDCDTPSDQTPSAHRVRPRYKQGNPPDSSEARVA
jgi:hypothetical protein